MENTKVFVETDGKVDYLDQYVLIKPDGTGMSVIANATIYTIGKAVVSVYNAFLNECTKYSDQDLYKVCEAIDLRYDIVLPLVREVRSNG